MRNFKQFIAASAVLVSASTVSAHTPNPQNHEDAGHHSAHSTRANAADQQPWGVAGQAAAVTRTITLRMTDGMRFTPSHFTVQLGETVRLRVANVGQLMHEIVLGTADSLDAHARAMLQHPGMAHGDAFMAHVAPQHNGELIWTFNRTGTYDFACLIAGHYQAGMRGSFTVAP